jgi:hypothetical protein
MPKTLREILLDPPAGPAPGFAFQYATVGRRFRIHIQYGGCHFKQVYKRIEAASHYNWADVALAFGYYDQSDFINEFKYFTGKSPETYFLSSPNGPDFFSANF